jgi:hypothetical protein
VISIRPSALFPVIGISIVWAATSIFMTNEKSLPRTTPLEIGRSNMWVIMVPVSAAPS